MKALVLVKPTPQTEAKIVAKPDGKGIEYAGVEFVINPYDEFAIEEAVKLKESGKVTEVVLCTFGTPNHKEVILKGLAVGADRAVLVDNQGCENFDSVSIAKVLAGVVKAENPDFVLAGKQAIDDDNMHIHTMVAELLNWPHVNVVAKLDLNGKTAKVEREVEGGQVEVYEVQLPCVLGAHKSLNKPRFAPLPGIMKARKKPFDIKKPADFGVDASALNAAPKARYTKFQPPPSKPAGKIFKGEPIEAMVNKVVDLLRNEARVI